MVACEAGHAAVAAVIVVGVTGVAFIVAGVAMGGVSSSQVVADVSGNAAGVAVIGACVIVGAARCSRDGSWCCCHGYWRRCPCC